MQSPRTGGHRGTRTCRRSTGAGNPLEQTGVGEMRRWQTSPRLGGLAAAMSRPITTSLSNAGRIVQSVPHRAFGWSRKKSVRCRAAMDDICAVPPSVAGGGCGPAGLRRREGLCCSFWEAEVANRPVFASPVLWGGQSAGPQVRCSLLVGGVAMLRLCHSLQL